MEGRAAHRLTGSQPAHAGEADLIQDPTFMYRYLYLPQWHSWAPLAASGSSYMYLPAYQPTTTNHDLRLATATATATGRLPTSHCHRASLNTRYCTRGPNYYLPDPLSLPPRQNPPVLRDHTTPQKGRYTAQSRAVRSRAVLCSAVQCSAVPEIILPLGPTPTNKVLSLLAIPDKEKARGAAVRCAPWCRTAHGLLCVTHVH